MSLFYIVLGLSVCGTFVVSDFHNKSDLATYFGTRAIMWACDPAVTGSIVGSYQAVLPVFAHALQAFLAAHCALVGDHLWPADATQAVLQDPNYDFIVVGAGSAGSVVANRLSEIADWKVLLIEAGDNPTLATEIPQLFFATLGSPVDWGYKNEPQSRGCKGYNQQSCAWPRGKVLGGCSSINGLYYVRANRLDYEEWAAAGNKGWSYEDVLPYFKKSENFSAAHTEEDKKYHGEGGYLSIDHGDDIHDFEKIIIKAGTELGLKYINDINGDSQMGITKSSITIKDGVRQSAARAFLSPIKDRKNFHVIKNAHVTKILFKPGTNEVIGVLLNKDGKDITVNAKKEVILSAGAINTPQLLLLSGIGPQRDLEELGIEVKADLPVGDNLQDHIYSPILYKLPGDKNLSSTSNIIGAFAQYMLEKKGPLATTAPFRVISFYNTTDSYATSPDIQFHYVVYPPRLSNLIEVYEKHGLSEEFKQKFAEINEDNFILMVCPTLLKPKSKGKIVLKSTNPLDHPLIYSNYYEEPEDLETILRAITQQALKLAETETLKNTGFELHWIELDACNKFDKTTEEFLKCWTDQVSFSLYHPTSTAKMGPTNDETAVVDSELKVRKINRLRVVDASIMPGVVRGNTNAPTIMIGEKGADMIKKFWLDTHTEL